MCSCQWRRVKSRGERIHELFAKSDTVGKIPIVYRDELQETRPLGWPKLRWRDKVKEDLLTLAKSEDFDDSSLAAEEMVQR